ncbi:Xanthan lyase precursor [Rubripirellula lacrimiformis]|uniref:Xanthan lyase n=2 Tax=Rubripirellula lacrimiformis TaxID=1930273 RepID=A0A517NKA9_9BACT|nr:Xanthan lyase precursor [Rubripirellula lacrimiformis]
MRFASFAWAAVCIWGTYGWSAEPPQVHDVVVYGGTSAGIVTGLQAKAMGKSVVVIEPSQRPGGLTTGGLGQTDIGNKQVIGGLSRSFYEKVAQHYSQPSAWTWQQRSSYRGGGQSPTEQGEAAMWTFEPSVALTIYQDWMADQELEIETGQRLDRRAGVVKDGQHIVSIQMESGRHFHGKMFIDATYEGDLMAAAGVSYTVGREANSMYGETLNGVQTQRSVYHNFVDGVDPYRVAGDPTSGLLPFIDPHGPGNEGEADRRVQAYCYRMCLTDHPPNRIPFHKPSGYDPSWFELLLRNFEAGESGMPWINSGMPNHKTDTNNRTGFSTDFIGQNYDYPDASYDERDRIAAAHLLYQQGLMWTLANHPRVPEKIRNQVARWGMCKDEFVEGNGWQKQLYVREARRMVSDFVMTQLHCQQVEQVDDSIGMGAYTMDSHNTQRYVDADGQVKNEGDVEVGGFPPYPISYRSIVPPADQADNLLVPVCLSSSHMAFGSIRMEPVFMVLGQSSATAACLAIDREVSVQNVEYSDLKKRLLADGQILDYQRPVSQVRGRSVDSFKGIVVDDTDATLSGPWAHGTLGGCVHLGYRHDSATADGLAKAVFETPLPHPGQYDVQVAYVANSNRATNVPVIVSHQGSVTETTVNQRIKPDIDVVFASVGTYQFDASGKVTIVNKDTDGHVIVDAVRWIPVRGN